jgi:hypothetical protein
MWQRTALVVAALVLPAGLDVAAAGWRSPASPFSKLFVPPPIAGQRQSPPAPAPRPRQPAQSPLPGAASSPAGPPRVACGTVLVPVNPEFDARIRKPAPVKPAPKSRTIPAPPCD